MIEKIPTPTGDDWKIVVLDAMITKVNELVDVANVSKSTPHRCPVCGGKGQVPPYFYETAGGSTSIACNWLPCKSCNGSGIIWEVRL